MKLRVLHAPGDLVALGPWTSDEPEAAPTREPLVFRVELSDALDDTDASFDRMERWLGDARRQLDAVPGRVEGALRRAHGPVSYDTTRLAPADAWLTQQLLPGAVDYGIGDKVKRALASILDVATRLAWVETCSKDGVLVARTRIGISGDVDTILGASTETWGRRALDFSNHQRAVEVARESKDAWLRILTMVTNVARQIARFGTNPLSALRTAWHYIRRIVSEVRAL